MPRGSSSATLCAVEHRHRCIYCRAAWFRYEDYPVSGASACDDCREKLRTSPDTPRHVIALRDLRVLDRLAEHVAERLRDSLRRRRQ